MAKRTSKKSAPKSSEIEIKNGHGGETHQQANPKDTPLTTNQGLPVSDDQNSLQSGQRGPTLLEDFIFARKSLISITSESPNEWCMLAAMAHTDISSLSIDEKSTKADFLSRSEG